MAEKLVPLRGLELSLPQVFGHQIIGCIVFASLFLDPVWNGTASPKARVKLLQECRGLRLSFYTRIPRICKAKNMTTSAKLAKAWGTEALRISREARRQLLDENAHQRTKSIQRNRYYHESLKRLLRYIVEPGKRVLEIRCATEHLLDALKPSYGVGVEISDKMIEIAGAQYPWLHFLRSDPETLELNDQFDYILFSHIFDTVDLLGTLERMRKCCHRNTRLIVYTYNYLWQSIMEWASRSGLRMASVEPNWVSEHDVNCFLDLAGYERVRTYRRILLPKWIPLLSYLFNDLLAFLPGLRRLCLVQVTVARPKPVPRREDDVTVSVVVPCRNERDNVLPAVERMPEMGKHTEIIFCDDKSTDGTGAEVQRVMKLFPHRDIRLVEGPGICKAENLWTGFRAARGDVLMILDGDLAVMPEELPYFFKALVSGAGEFINGSRLVYPVPRAAMKFTNMIGNKVLALCSRICLISASKILCAEPRSCGKRIGTGSSAIWGIGGFKTVGEIMNSFSAPANCTCRYEISRCTTRRESMV